jgi:hypothetical protein
MEIIMKRTVHGTFAPLFEEDLEAVRRIPLDAEVLVDFRRPRNLKFHRKFMKLVRTVHGMQETYPSVETMLDAIKIAVGHCEILVAHDGKPFYRTLSINFHQMEESDFEKFYSRAIDACLANFLPKGVTPAELQNAVNAVMHFA